MESLRLSSYGSDLDLDIDNLQRLCANIDVYKSWVHCTVEMAESGHKADGA